MNRRKFMYYNSILETVGNTPLIKLNKISEGFTGTFLVKVEYFNPGHSIKDRIAIKMIDDAEKAGLLKPGGTIIEGTSGNTGMGLALVAVTRGYKCVFTTTDKQSQSKVDLLRALGAEVIVCPTNVEPEDPQSYYSVAERLHKEIPNSFYPNQYDNISNAQAHYESTGPEIWEQTEGKITHFVVGVGTGGTISGVAKYLKEKNPNIKIWGVDTYGSVFKKYHETGEFDTKEIYSYITEGIGEDILPKNVDFSVIDHFTKVTDKDAAVYCRKLAVEEGIFVGMSSGSAIKGLLQLKEELKPDDVVVVLFHDSGSRYVGKIFNDEWMRERGYLDEKIITAEDLIKNHIDKPLIVVRTEELVSHAVDKMRQFKISQIPVIDNTGFVGSLDDAHLLQAFVNNPEIAEIPIKEVMGQPYPVIAKNTVVDEVSKLITKDNNAVLVDLGNGAHHIITKYDIINSIK